jgi:hypothetical protein
MANYVDVIWSLLFSQEEQEQFDQDPDGYLAEKGIADSSPEQIREAVVMACERGPASAGTAAASTATQALVVPPPPPSAGHPPTVQETVEYYVTQVNENYTIDDRDTFVDNRTAITAGDGAVINIDNDTNITGDDSILIDGENTGDVVTGDGNVVNSDGNAFGDGAVAADGNINAPVNTGEFDGTQTDDNTNVGGVGDGASGIGNVDGGLAVGDDLNIGGEQDNSSDDSTNIDVDVNTEPDEPDVGADGGGGLGGMGKAILPGDAAALRGDPTTDDETTDLEL